VAARLALIVVGLAAVVAAPSAQNAPSTDLDAFMSRVLERRDQNWKKLQQYVLEERETFQLTGPAGAPLYGFRREYAWFPREGFFIRSPLRADGVEIGEDERQRAEDAYLQRQQRREERRARRSDAPPDDLVSGGSVEDVVRQSFEPQFISSANFLRFRFDPGQYAFAGREQLLNREVLRIEYYPTKLFAEGRTRPNRRLRDEDPQVQQKMNKVSLVTLWVEPTGHQILQYQFDNIDLDFLPAGSLVRVDGMHASMRMNEPFPDVWLPASIEIRFGLTLAIGEVAGRYEASYRDYRLATVTTTVR
jgi:hypothetical protein